MDRTGIFAGDDPFAIARAWLAEAEPSEPNDPNAIALATVDASGLPNVRMVLLKDIEPAGFVFYTNYGSRKGQEIEASGKAAFVLHWKSLRRQIRVRGLTEREEGPQADEYYASRSLKSRLGAWASRQSEPLSSRTALMAEVAKVTYVGLGSSPKTEETEITEELVGKVWEGLHRLIGRYMQPSTGYTARRALFSTRDEGDYDHLSRFGEWDLTDRAEKQDVGGSE